MGQKRQRKIEHIKKISVNYLSSKPNLKWHWVINSSTTSNDGKGLKKIGNDYYDVGNSVGPPRASLAPLLASRSFTR